MGMAIYIYGKRHLYEPMTIGGGEVRCLERVPVTLHGHDLFDAVFETIAGKNDYARDADLEHDDLVSLLEATQSSKFAEYADDIARVLAWLDEPDRTAYRYAAYGMSY